MTAGAMTTSVDRNPYVGVRPFRAEESSLFFARGAHIRDLVTRWTADPLTVLHGPAGAGKTSLLHAGVIPALGWPMPDLLPTGRLAHGPVFPAGALPEHNSYTLALLASWAPAEPPALLAGLRIRDFLLRRGVRTDHYGEQIPILAAIDQFEDLFTMPEEHAGERAAFLDELGEACEGVPRLRLLLSVREEYLADIAGRLGPAGEHPLSAFSAEEAREAVVGPMEKSGRWFGPGTAEEMVTDLGAGTGVIEPVLIQVACGRLWRSLPAAVQAITTDDLRDVADIEPALTDFCAGAVTATAAEHGLSPQRLASWLRHAFVTDDHRRGAVDVAGGDVAGLPEPVAWTLEQHHLLKAAGPGGRRYTLLHDRLIGPLLRVGVSEPSSYAAPPAGADVRQTSAPGTGVAAPERGELERRAETELLRGNRAYARGDAEGAERHYRAAAARYDRLQDTLAVTRLLVAIGRALLAQGRDAEAVAELQAATARAPSDPAVQTELGRMLWQAGRNDAALTVLADVLATNGDTAEALLTRGEMLADLGQAEEALRDLDRVPRHQRPSTRAARALALATLRDPRAAGEEIGTALADAPDNGPVLLYAARIGVLDGDRSRASALARRATEARAPALSPHQREKALRLTETDPDDLPR